MYKDRAVGRGCQRGWSRSNGGGGIDVCTFSGKGVKHKWYSMRSICVRRWLHLRDVMRRGWSPPPWQRGAGLLQTRITRVMGHSGAPVRLLDSENEPVHWLTLSLLRSTKDASVRGETAVAGEDRPPRFRWRCITMPWDIWWTNLPTRCGYRRYDRQPSRGVSYFGTIICIVSWFFKIVRIIGDILSDDLYFLII